MGKTQRTRPNPEAGPPISSPTSKWYYALVGDVLFKINPSLLLEESPVFSKILETSRQDSPVVLKGHSAEQFSKLLWTLTRSPLPKPSQVSFVDFIAVGELAYQYGFSLAQQWALSSLYTLVIHDNCPLLAASSDLFVRLLRLALYCSDKSLAVAVQSVWSDRIHLHQLPPRPAIEFAEEYDLRFLLVHAYYAQMLVEAPGHHGAGSIKGDTDLTTSQRTHVLEGYYSLLVYWKHFRDNPLDFPQPSSCPSHDRCLSAWRIRWTYAAEYPIRSPSVDILRRLRFMQISLKADNTLQSCMSVRCRNLALDSLARKACWIGANLHHHFDL